MLLTCVRTVPHPLVQEALSWQVSALGTQRHWDAGEEWMEEWNVGASKPFPNCDHLSSCKTQTLIWTWLGIVWAGEVWVWGEEVSMKLILCLSSLECQ